MEPRKLLTININQMRPAGQRHALSNSHLLHNSKRLPPLAVFAWIDSYPCGLALLRVLCLLATKRFFLCVFLTLRFSKTQRKNMRFFLAEGNERKGNSRCELQGCRTDGLYCGVSSTRSCGRHSQPHTAPIGLCGVIESQPFQGCDKSRNATGSSPSQLSTLNSQLSILNSQFSILNSQLSTLKMIIRNGPKKPRRGLISITL